MINAYWEALEFDLPAMPEGTVSREAPKDIIDPPAAPPVPGMRYRMMPRSVAALFVRIVD